ncbi:asparagine synthase (glutamine-hydrolyzing) [Sulfurimonas sp.]|uniref:asparagine synthase (glutamine-hydrolyzing) n=1 Tax=Sulfurimonas sp. TaxID=2022749 RepID=UPI003565D2A7
MCGISGIINKNANCVDKNEITKMNDLISHRGPDSDGFYFQKNFAFAHRRLSILDLSDDGHQPMNYMDKFTITYNGEIYNYLEIKQELIEFGYVFKSHTDTEVILAAYDKWEQKCVEKFNGMWAFAIYDKEKDIIFCSRDRFGIKPFYYLNNSDKFIFGSEIKQLLNFNNKNKVNKKILVNYVVTGYLEYSEETFFSNIIKLQGSHNLVYDLKNNTFNIYKYYNIKIDEDIKKLSLEKSVELYKNELSRSIEYRLRSDVKVGTCLSGGLDSSTVATMASEKYEKSSDSSFTAIHAKSIDKATDESLFAEQVANISNLDMNVVEPSIKDFKKSIEEVVYTQEEPFGSTSIFMQYFVMKKAKNIGCTVLLDGQGGDETLLGYDKYYPAMFIDIFKNHGFFSLIRSIHSSSKHSNRMGIMNILKFSIGFSFAEIRKKLYIKQCSFLKESYLDDFKVLNHISNKYFSIEKLQELEIINTNLPALLRYEDKNSMKNSIETRLPFIDYKTLETALSINNSFKIKDGWSKYILRKTIENILPKNIVYRTDKLGFASPQDIWLDSISEDMKKEVKRSTVLNEISDMNILIQQFDALKSSLKWRLYNIAIWERVYNVKL